MGSDLRLWQGILMPQFQVGIFLFEDILSRRFNFIPSTYKIHDQNTFLPNVKAHNLLGDSNSS